MIEREETTPRKRKLLPVIRVTFVRPKVCGSCRYGSFEENGGSFNCQRPNGPSFDAGDKLYWYRTCSRWTDVD
jgi:hypothetical protein